MERISYYGGSTVAGGRIRPLEAASFQTFCGRYIDIPHQISMNRDDFLAKTKDERDEIKDGPYFCACTFKEGTTSRKDGNASQMVLACFDIDDANDARDFTESPEALAAALHPFAFTSYTTANHTPENPRLRIVVELEPMETKLHKQVINSIARLLGLPPKFSGARESKVISQPMYRPVSFIDDDGKSPVLISRVNGKRFQTDDIPDDIEEEITDEVFDEDGDIFRLSDLTHLPIPDLDLPKADEMLANIDPDIDYEKWTHCACGLKHQFAGDDEREAFELFNTWSAGGSKYTDRETTYKKWKSFRPVAEGKTPITIRTIMRYAKDAGWDSTPVVKIINASIQDWITTTEDHKKLLAEGAERIAASPFLNDVVEESLIEDLRIAIKKNGGHNITRRTILGQIKKCRRIEKTKDLSDNVPGWLRGWVYVAGTHKFVKADTGLELKPEAFDAKFNSRMMPRDPTDDAAASGRPPVTAVNHALNIVEIKKVDGVAYDPRHNGEEPFYEHQGKTYLNQYTKGSVPESDPDRKEECREALDTLLKTLIGEEEIRVQLLQYLAYNVQRPGHKIRWIPWFQGAQGAGKSLLAEIVAASVGVTNVKIVNPNVITGDFNDWTFGCHWVIIDEFKLDGKSAVTVMNKIKDFITNDRIALNQKFQDVRVIENVANGIILTNFHNALHIDDSDRRYFVIKSRLQSKQAVERVTATGLFERIGMLVEEHPGGFRAALMDVDIDDININGPAPKTIYRGEVIKESKNPLLEKIEELIEDPSENLITDDLILGSHLDDKTAAESTNNYNPSHFLSELGYLRHKSGKKFRINGRMSYVWVHPDRFDGDIEDPVETLERLTDTLDEIPD